MTTPDDNKAKTLTTAEVAEKLKTDPKTLRTFLRAQHADQRPGKGARWELDPKDLAVLRKSYLAWTKKREADKAARAEAKKAEAAKADETEQPKAEAKPAE